MSNFREIIIKDVICKAKKTSTNKFFFNNSFSGVNNIGSVLVNGSFDVNIWYSYNNYTKTAVSTKRFTYQEKMNVPLKSDSILDNTSEILVRILKQPTVTNVDIKGSNIELTIEKELRVEIVGNTKVKVSVEDFDDDYEEIMDDDLDIEIDNIKEKYLDIEVI